MARQRRSLDEHLADMATRGRNDRSVTFSTPAMAPLGPSLIADDAILTEHLSEGSVTLAALDDGLKETLAGSETAIADAAARLEAEAARIDALFEEVENGGGVGEEDLAAILATAAADAKTKADAAKEAALAAAKTYADAQATGASGAALEAAKLDATAKADAAKIAAIAAAEADAKNKADRALADAIADASKRAINMIPTGDFEAGTIPEIFKGSGSNNLNRWQVMTPGAAVGTRFLRYTHAATTDAAAVMPDVPVVAGRTYRFGVWARNPSGGAPTASGIGWPVQWRNADRTLNNSNWPKLFYVADFGSKLTAEWQYFEADAIAPTGAIAAIPRFYGYVASGPAGMVLDFGAFTMRDVTDSLAAQAAAAADATSKMNNVANSKNATFYGTAAPTATAPKGGLAGDTYRQRNTAGNIIGEWEWSGTAWAQRKMTSESMTAVDVGVLTAGSAIIQDAVLKKVAAGTASFQQVDIGNLIVSGDTVMKTAVIDKLYADVVRSRELVADKVKAGAVDGQRITGATIETDAAANAGVKIDTKGIISHGSGSQVVNGVTTHYITKALINHRKAPVISANDIWPGLWFESTPTSGTATPPYSAAGVAAMAADSQGIYMRSAVNTELSGHASVEVAPYGASVGAVGDRPNPFTAPSFTGRADVRPDTFHVVNDRAGVGTMAGVRHYGGGELELEARNGIYVKHGPGSFRRRVPVGMLGYWKNTTEILIVKDTQVMSMAVTIPPQSWVRMNSVLRGYPNVNNQFMQLKAFANGVLFGESTTYSETGWLGTDSRTSFLYRNTSTSWSTVTFRLTGTNAMPSQTNTYVMPMGNTGVPTAEVYFEDLGDI